MFGARRSRVIQRALQDQLAEMILGDVSDGAVIHVSAGADGLNRGRRWRPRTAKRSARGALIGGQGPDEGGGKPRLFMSSVGHARHCMKSRGCRGALTKWAGLLPCGLRMSFRAHRSGGGVEARLHFVRPTAPDGSVQERPQRISFSGLHAWAAGFCSRRV